MSQIGLARTLREISDETLTIRVARALELVWLGVKLWVSMREPHRNHREVDWGIRQLSVFAPKRRVNPQPQMKYGTAFPLCFQGNARLGCCTGRCHMAHHAHTAGLCGESDWSNGFSAECFVHCRR